ncbi:MAG: phosphoadenosine phosphosulfate reductase, partial [Alphaproteobacteria bacterium]|nr:phosphoadenosine phosphosulfate reductase [Alphaproteobacteria bacterium]
MLWSPPEAPFDAARREKVDAARRRLVQASAHQRAALATSLQAEDQVLTHLIAEAGLSIEIFALETGRLHAETLAAMAATEARYGLAIARVRPDPAAVAAYVKSD